MGLLGLSRSEGRQEIPQRDGAGPARLPRRARRPHGAREFEGARAGRRHARHARSAQRAHRARRVRRADRRAAGGRAAARDVTHPAALLRRDVPRAPAAYGRSRGRRSDRRAERELEPRRSAALPARARRRRAEAAVPLCDAHPHHVDVPARSRRQAAAHAEGPRGVPRASRHVPRPADEVRRDQGRPRRHGGREDGGHDGALRRRRLGDSVLGAGRPEPHRGALRSRGLPGAPARDRRPRDPHGARRVRVRRAHQRHLGAPPPGRAHRGAAPLGHPRGSSSSA